MRFGNLGGFGPSSCEAFRLASRLGDASCLTRLRGSDEDGSSMEGLFVAVSMGLEDNLIVMRPNRGGGFMYSLATKKFGR